MSYPRLPEVTFKKAREARKAMEEQMRLGRAEIDEPLKGIRGRGCPRHIGQGRTRGHFIESVERVGVFRLRSR